MILCAAFHRAFPSQLSLCTGAQLLSEVWSAPHAPGPRRPPGQQQPLRSPCPARGAARSRRPAEPLQLGPAAGPGSQRREPPWDTTAGPPGHRTPWGPAGAPEMPRGGQCGRVLCRSCKALASPLKRNRQPRTLIPSCAPLWTGSARQDAPEGCGRPPARESARVLAAPLDPAAPACPASLLLTGRCVRSVLGHAAPCRCCWKLSLPHTHYGLDYRAIIPPSSCVIRRSRAFTLLMASADPRLRRARKAANRPEPALRVPCWRCAEGWGCA